MPRRSDRDKVPVALGNRRVRVARVAPVDASVAQDATDRLRRGPGLLRSAEVVKIVFVVVVGAPRTALVITSRTEHATRGVVMVGRRGITRHRGWADLRYQSQTRVDVLEALVDDGTFLTDGSGPWWIQVGAHELERQSQKEMRATTSAPLKYFLSKEKEPLKIYLKNLQCYP